MDLDKQIYESDAQGWQRGLYEDIKDTFRAPTVNSIWRAQMYHYPELLRYIWGQIKPVFQTWDFAAFTVAYRDELLSAIEEDVPQYDRRTIDIPPHEFRELQGQVATYDSVAPRLFIMFKLMHRRIHGQPVGGSSNRSNRTTRPFPVWLDDNRGRPPTMLSQKAARDAIPDSLAGGLDDMVPSIYRILAQWPKYLDVAWSDLEPIFGSRAFEEASDAVDELADTYLDRLPYTPQVDPQTLSSMGFTDEAISDHRDLYDIFDEEATSVVVRLPIYAETVGVTGERDALQYP